MAQPGAEERLDEADDPANCLERFRSAACGQNVTRFIMLVQYILLGNKDEARRYFERGRAIVASFAEKSENQRWVGYLKSFDEDIAALDK